MSEECIACNRPLAVHCQGCGECHPVPDYEAALDALERLLPWVNYAGDRDVAKGAHAAGQARHVLARLRGDA